MAADAAPTLEELEHLLPPEMFHEMGFRDRSSNQQQRNHREKGGAAALRRTGGDPPLLYMDDIGYQLASFGLRDRSFSSSPFSQNPVLNVSPRPEGLQMANRPMARFGWAAAAASRGTGAYIPGSKPVLPPAQVNGYGMARGGGGAVQRPLVRFVAPVRPGFKGRESGTGVFLPRAAFTGDNGNAKKAGTKGGDQQQQQPIRHAVARKPQGEATRQTPETAEMGLPHEWTY